MAVALDALASYVQNMLMELAKEKMHMLCGVSGEIDNMGIKLRDIKNVLADADRRKIADQSVQTWVRELRNAMYNATDILDLCQLKAIERGLGWDVGCLNPLLFCMQNPLHAYKIASRIKNLNQVLQSIQERSTTFNFNLSSYEDGNRKVAFPLPSRETSGELNESSVVGEKIEEDTKYLVDKLIQGDEISRQDGNKIMVFSIVGVGGIGKTTLAKKILNNELIKEEFSKTMWLSVNQVWCETELLSRAITEAKGDLQAVGNTKGALERTLKKALMGHKTLLVMDDVWNSQAWAGVLETPLVNSVAQGSRVIVTTRHDTVARGMNAVKPYHYVQKLWPEDAWSLLKKQVVGNENTTEHEIDELKGIGMGIIKKCDFLPLAVKVMGGLLRQKKKTPGDWEKVLNDTIWSINKMPEELNYAIYLSYDDLHPPLKQCFLYFSFLPENLVFYASDIIGMWISEGFIHGSSHELEELGREYYDELLFRNLIEQSMPLYTSENHCKMHDVVRLFGQYVARDEALVAHMGEIDITSKLDSHTFLRLSLCNKGSESNVEWSSLHSQTSLRTLVSIGHIKIKQGDSLVMFPSLRTLHLYSTDCSALVESLYKLKHLRYLSMDKCGISILPEKIGKMKLLQYIRISRNESLVKLPDSIVELRQLRALHLGGTGINKIPMGFCVLNNLRELMGFPAHIDGEWCSLQELGPLSKLRFLHIVGLENVSASTFATKAMLGSKVRLSSLNLQCTTRLGDDGRLVKEAVSEDEQQQIKVVFDELCPPSCLDRLVINGYFGQQLPRWMISATVVPFERLRILRIRDLACCTVLPDRLCQLPYLEALHIHRAPAIQRVGHEFLQLQRHCHNRSQGAAMFPRLHDLELIGMMEWEEWEWEEQVHAMPVLEILKLERCKLSRVPPGLAFNARALRKLFVFNVKHLSSLENFTSVIDLNVFECPDLESISNFPKLQNLDMVKCLKLKVLEGVPALQRLNLKDYDMERLPGYLQNVNPMHLVIDCTLSLLASIAAEKSSREWDKFSHIQQVQAYADAKDVPRKWHVLYTRDTFRFETNISRSAIKQGYFQRDALDEVLDVASEGGEPPSNEGRM